MPTEFTGNLKEIVGNLTIVKHSKGTGKQSIADALVESQAIRTKVANAVACTKAVGRVLNIEDEDKKERELWEDAKKSVLEFHDNDDCNTFI